MSDRVEESGSDGESGSEPELEVDPGPVTEPREEEPDLSDLELRAELEIVLEVMIADNRRRWVMDAGGGYEQVRPGDDPVVDCRAVLAERVRAGASFGADWEPARWG